MKKNDNQYEGWVDSIKDKCDIISLCARRLVSDNPMCIESVKSEVKFLQSFGNSLYCVKLDVEKMSEIIMENIYSEDVFSEDKSKIRYYHPKISNYVSGIISKNLFNETIDCGGNFMSSLNDAYECIRSYWNECTVVYEDEGEIVRLFPNRVFVMKKSYPLIKEYVKRLLDIREQSEKNEENIRYKTIRYSYGEFDKKQKVDRSVNSETVVLKTYSENDPLAGFYNNCREIDEPFPFAKEEDKTVVSVLGEK